MNSAQRMASVAGPDAAQDLPHPFWTMTGNRPDATALVAFYIAYMLAAAFGQWMMLIPGVPITVWPPNGVILAMLLTQPRSSWIWWLAIGALGELTGNALWFANPLHWALGYVLANAAAVIIAAMLLGPYLKTPIRRLGTLPQVLAFLVLGALVAPVVSATLGSAINTLVGKGAFGTSWPVWWLGDATGILIATPLVISMVNAWKEVARPTAPQLAEGAAIGLSLAALSAWEIATGASYAFLLPLPVLWAALRFEFRGVSLAVLGLGLSIGVHARWFAAEMSEEAFALMHARLQALVLVAASTGLIVAAIMRQQRQAVSDLARANTDLEARVAERTLAIEAAERRFRATFQNAGVGISIVTGEGQMLRVNDSLARMLGYEVADMEGQDLDRFTHPDDLAIGVAARDRLHSGAADEYDIEKRYMHKDGSVVWGHTTVSCVRDDEGRVAYLIKIIQDITDRRKSEEVRQLLTREVNHRSKNLLTIVQVIARRTAAGTPEDFVRTFSERLRALAANQDLLVNSEWQRVGLRDLVCSQLDHLGTVGGDRVAMHGPAVTVRPAAAQALGMALHELATNAMKYGSLSTDTGRVNIDWQVENETFRLRWRESGGPPVIPPDAEGFGTTVLDTMTASSMSGQVSIDYAHDGLVWELRCPVGALQDDQDSGSEPAQGT